MQVIVEEWAVSISVFHVPSEDINVRYRWIATKESYKIKVEIEKECLKYKFLCHGTTNKFGKSMHVFEQLEQKIWALYDVWLYVHNYFYMEMFQQCFGL